MRNAKLYILLTTVLLFVMSSIMGFCGLGGVVAEMSTEARPEVDATSYVEEWMDTETPASTSSISEENEVDVSEWYFDLAAESMIRSSSWNTASSLQWRTPVKRTSIHTLTSWLETHFTLHKYFNHAALPQTLL